MKKPKSAAESTTKMQPYISPLAVWALSVGSAIGWGSLVVTSKSYLAQGGVLGSVLGLLAGFVLMLMVASHYSFLARRYPGLIPKPLPAHGQFFPQTPAPTCI